VLVVAAEVCRQVEVVQRDVWSRDLEILMLEMYGSSDIVWIEEVERGIAVLFETPRAAVVASSRRSTIFEIFKFSLLSQ
jgi:hypothetical protein